MVTWQRRCRKRRNNWWIHCEGMESCSPPWKSKRKRKVEVIKEAIKQVMEEGDVDERLLLSKLMSQLEGESEEEEDKIVKELKKVRRQNVITHCLLYVMILLTAAWQISEVSLILKLKQGVTHPFRSLGSLLLKGLIKPRRPLPQQQHQDADAQPCNLIDSTPQNHQH